MFKLHKLLCSIIANMKIFNYDYIYKFININIEFFQLI